MGLLFESAVAEPMLYRVVFCIVVELSYFESNPAGGLGLAVATASVIATSATIDYSQLARLVDIAALQAGVSHDVAACLRNKCIGI